MALITRSGKGSPLTIEELDGNFTYLEGLSGASSSNTSTYKVYSAIVDQSGTSAPTAIILENTFGITPSFTYEGVGQYKIVITGELIDNKSVGFASLQNGFAFFNKSIFQQDEFSITSKDSSLNISNNVFTGFIEIRVYE